MNKLVVSCWGVASDVAERTKPNRPSALASTATSRRILAAILVCMKGLLASVVGRLLVKAKRYSVQKPWALAHQTETGLNSNVEKRVLL